MKLLCVFCSVQFKRQNLCLVRFMALPQNTARNIFDFMSVHLAVYFIDNVVVNAACPCYNTCMTTNNLPHQWQSTDITSELGRHKNINWPLTRISFSLPQANTPYIKKCCWQGIQRTLIPTMKHLLSLPRTNDQLISWMSTVMDRQEEFTLQQRNTNFIRTFTS